MSIDISEFAFVIDRYSFNNKSDKGGESYFDYLELQ